MDHVEDSIASHTIRIPTLQFPLKGFALEWVSPKIIQRVNNPLVQSRFPHCHTPRNSFGVMRKFNPIGGQENP